jgi:malate dehydrogenase
MPRERAPRRKVSILGAGHVGATVAQRIVEAGLADVVLLDVVPGLPQGKALDLAEAGPLLGHDVTVMGTNEYAETADSTVLVVTAGHARQPGMRREDLLAENAKIVRSVVEQAVPHSPNAVLVVVTDPLDAMCHVALQASGFPRWRVIGMAGVLDAARFRAFIAQELDVSVENVVAFVLGGHGDTMVPLVRYTNVAGIPLTDLLDKAAIDRIVQRTRDGGAEIVKYLKTGSAYYAPSSSAVEMVESILKDKKKILPCAAYLEGEYGIHGLYVGVPVKLGEKGIEKIYEIKLSEEEKAGLLKSAAAVQELVDVMKPKLG